MLTDTQLQEFKTNLEVERASLAKEFEKDTTSVPEFGVEVDSNDTEADEAEELANNLATAAALKERIQEIDDALVRMEEGKYGTCLKCGMEISKEVLSAAPESSLCENCKIAEIGV